MLLQNLKYFVTHIKNSKTNSNFVIYLSFLKISQDENNTLLRYTASRCPKRVITFEESFQISQICAADSKKSTKKTTSIRS